MRRRAWLLLALLLGGATQATASQLTGRWLTGEDGGVVEIVDCGDDVCGTVLSSRRLVAHPNQLDAYNRNPALRSRPIRGLPLFEDMRGGPTVWKGRVYNPADGGLYAGSLKLTGLDTLKLTGCIVFPLCKSQTWTRVR